MESQQAPERLGRYRILKEIGRGGMATVYHAVQEGPHGFENHVALKLIHEKLLAAYPRVVKMLVDEARVAARIHHPNVMRILDLVEQENRVYMVMDFVDGISMRGVLDHARETRNPPAIAPVLEVLGDACNGIHAAHQLKAADGTYLNLVHRDMKPGNIMVSIDGHVKVGDFGIALFADRMADSTAQGQLKGTPAYMAPEQTLGGPLDARSDVFSMGLTLYTLSTTKLAFRAKKAMQIALKIARESLEPHAVELDQIVAGLGDVLRKACAHDPDERFQDAAALGEALREIHATLDEPLTIPEMLRAAGWRPAPPELIDQGEALELGEDSLYSKASEIAAVSLLPEPIEGPEDNELTETVDANDDQSEVDTNTYIPSVTELNTDLEATPIAPPRLEQTEPVFPDDAAARLDRRPAAVHPPTTAPTAESAGPGAVSGSVPSAKYVPEDPAQQTVPPAPEIVLHERDHRGRVIPSASPDQTRVSQGEKYGIAITAGFLLIAISAIVIYQVSAPGEPSEATDRTEAATNSDLLEGGVAIADQDASSAQTYGAAENGINAEAADNTGITIEEELTVQEDTVPDVEGDGREASPVVAEGPAKSPQAGKPVRQAPSEPVADPPRAEPRAPAAAEDSGRKPEKADPPAATAEPSEAAGMTESTESQPVTDEPGLITVNSYPWSEVHIDGNKVGVTPLQEYSLPAGLYTIRLVFPSAGKRETVEKVEVRPGKHARIVRKLPPAEPAGD